jgi:hypothetical protein
MKKKFKRYAEPSEGVVHLESCGLMGNVTLCGMTDWINAPEGDGEETTDPVTCQSCLAIVEFIKTHTV